MRTSVGWELTHLRRTQRIFYRRTQRSGAATTIVVVLPQLEAAPTLFSAWSDLKHSRRTFQVREFANPRENAVGPMSRQAWVDRLTDRLANERGAMIDRWPK